MPGLLKGRQSTAYTWLITGSSRGIGFEIVRQLLASPSNAVIATCRNPSGASALQELKKTSEGRLHLVQLDANNAESIQASVSEAEKILGSRGLNYLVNNAGVVHGKDTAFAMTAKDVTDTFITNVVGPMLVSQAYLPLLDKAERKVIMNVSSGYGSIGRQESGKLVAAYSISKAALNMLVTKQAQERPDIISYVINPGWVKTDMGGKEGKLEPEESVRQQLKVATSATLESTGKFFDYDGSLLEW
ncbi:hypothetical protein EWM64_g4173 [Hericium alpestre]|uniref:NAD(P)-binding protein n=1 Tax=Hericium alpestre TaxID=135208 RepID=A0A4Z0A2C0_9AGAM|nr:hypothetical protein EWM64_g4173 [Hericium alpestre]